jgi:hypothetical protein
MGEQDDWFTVDDEGLHEKIREDRDLTNLTEKALVIFWKFKEWCQTKGSFMLSSFMFILVAIFGVEIKNCKKI